jgi:hypothetical protein
MKQKILAELKKKFPGLQNEFLLFIAAKLEAKVKEDSEIEGAITELDTILPIKEQADFFQSESDRRVTEAIKKAEKKPDEKKEDEKKDDKLSPDEETRKMLKSLSEKLEAFEKKESQSKLSERLKIELSKKKIPLQFAKRVVVESEDQLDVVLAEIETEYNEVMQGKIDSELEGSSRPKGSSGKTLKAASKEETSSVLNLIT